MLSIGWQEDTITAMGFFGYLGDEARKLSAGTKLPLKMVTQKPWLGTPLSFMKTKATWRWCVTGLKKRQKQVIKMV
ncbi:hypothetical protein D3C84_1036290 [compost metagenome]